MGLAIPFIFMLNELLVIKHEENIERLWKGTESRMGQGRPG
jgi:glycerol-3-phosphate acyltransferase PlsY